ncbi:hypothetical protein BKI52_34090 [marine bacterium AO1-C]|nr:hypothetical protein BKI52_34090 [marine bacterium AO1-C]
MKKLNLIFGLLFTLVINQSLFAQQHQHREIGRFAVLSGLHQPIVLKGGNFAFNYITKNNISLEASFGVGLSYDNLLSEQEQSQYSSISTPFSYGIGIGYFYKGFSLNFEPKGTMFRVKDQQGKEVTYTTYSIGAGLYYNLFVWKKLFLQPSIRYWHKVGASLTNGEVEMVGQNDQAFIHQARKPGTNGWIYGVSLGWFF